MIDRLFHKILYDRYGLVELASSIEEIGDVAKNKDKHYDNSKFLLTCFNSVLQINL